MIVYRKETTDQWQAAGVAQRVADFVLAHPEWKESVDIAAIGGFTEDQVKWALKNPPAGVVYFIL